MPVALTSAAGMSGQRAGGGSESHALGGRTPEACARDEADGPKGGAELIRRGMRVEFLVLAISPISAPFLSTRREGVVSMRIPFSYSSVRPMDDKF